MSDITKTAKYKNTILNRSRLKFFTLALIASFVVSASVATAQGNQGEAQSSEGWGDLGTDSNIFNAEIYGYLEAFVEKVEDTPSIAPDGTFGETSNPHEFDVSNFNMMVYGTVRQRYDFFINLAAPGAGSNTDDRNVDLRNAWLEVPIAGESLVIRAGKTYRRFGLYNEILDATPTFIGIEPPELFDGDHLLLTRTTNFMAYGKTNIGGSNFLNYSIATGNDERFDDEIPIGGDLSIDIGEQFKIGSSFYWSGGDAAPSVAVGDGTSSGGVENWMEKDEYHVYGAYAEMRSRGLILQAAFWEADHDAIRDADSVLALADSGLNPRQRNRFYAGGDAANGVGNLAVDYKVRTYYLRAGYSLALPGNQEVVPYAQLDRYENPETIANKDFGGDNEAGIADDGEFWKFTLGAVYRPVPEIALKLDASSHLQDFNGSSEDYYEIRAAFSYLWQLGEI